MISLVTGSTGFVGRHLKEQLIFKGGRVAWITRDNVTWIQHPGKNPTPIKLPDLINAGEHITFYHLATNYDPDPLESSAVEALVEANILFPTKILDQFEDLDNLQVIYTCSYQQLLPLEYSNQYSLSKEYLCSFLKQKKINHKLIYLYDTYGRRDNRNKVVDVFTKKFFPARKYRSQVSQSK